MGAVAVGDSARLAAGRAAGGQHGWLSWATTTSAEPVGPSASWPVVRRGAMGGA